MAAFYDEKTGSYQYVIADKTTRSAAIIDPVLDYDEKAAVASARNADAIDEYIEAERLKVEWILDTHPHADHFSTAPYLAERFGAPLRLERRSWASKSCGITGRPRLCPAG